MMIPLNPDTVGAQAKLDAWAKETEARTGIKIRVDGLAARTEFRNLQAEARAMAGATQSWTSKIFDIAKVQQYAAGLGAAKQAFDGINGTLHLVNDEQQKAVDQTIDLASQGVHMGAAFGPWGALIGGAVGATAAIGINLYKWYESAQPHVNQLEEVRDWYVKIKGDIQIITAGWGTQLGLMVQQVDMMQGIDKLREKGTSVTGRKTSTTQELKDEYTAAVALNDLYASQTKGGVLFDEEWNTAFKANVAREVAAKAALQSRLDAEIQATDKATESIKKHTEAVKEDTKATQGPTFTVDRDRLRFEQESELAVAAMGQDDKSKQALTAQQSLADSLYAAHKVHNDEMAALDGQAAEDAKATLQRRAGYVMSITGNLTAQLEQNIAQGNRAMAGMGAALESGVADVLKAKGKEWSVKALGELAEGLALLGSPIPGARALASTKFAAAAEYGVAAAAAGVGGAALGGAASRRHITNRAEGGSEAGSNSAPASSGRISDPGTTAMAPMVFNFNTTVPMTERQRQEAWRDIQKLRPRL